MMDLIRAGEMLPQLTSSEKNKLVPKPTLGSLLTILVKLAKKTQKKSFKISSFSLFFVRSYY